MAPLLDAALDPAEAGAVHWVTKLGGEVIGVIPGYLKDLEHGHPHVTDLEVVDSMHSRKQRMFDLSDGFVTLPGGGNIEELKRQNLSAHSRVEQEEELLTNNLMKKLEKVNSEKREMLMRVEQEEEFLTNSLQKRLDRVMREKLELEAQMAREHEQLDKASGDLERRLEALSSERERLSAEKVELERQLEAEQEFIVNKLQKQTTNLAREKEQLRAEREDLRRQVEKLLSDKIRLNKEKVELENVMEAEEESIVNRLQMQMLELFQRNKYLERRLEAGSQTPSVVSESETSEDEGGSHHASRRQFGHGTSPQHRSWKHPHAMGIPHDTLSDPETVEHRIREAQTLAESCLRPVALLLSRDLMWEDA